MQDPRRPVVRSPARRRSIALTGARSFLGRNLVGMLEEDENVGRIVTIDIARTDTGSAKTRHYELDLTLPTADERVAEIMNAESVDTLVHLAFLASPAHSTAFAHELESVGTMHLLNGARQRPPRHLVHWSQTWLYGAGPSNPNYLTEAYPLAAPEQEPFFADKVAAELEVARFARQQPATTVTVLRTAPIVGPTARNFMTSYLSTRIIVTLLGFDPLWQFLHEVDALAAFKTAIDRPVDGIFNVVGDGVLPLSKIVRLAGRVRLPVPHVAATPPAVALWLGELAPWPPGFLPYLRFLCVADGELAAERLGFRAAYGTQEALMDFVSAQRLRDARLARALES